MTDAYGAITWWGFSPALDLQDEDIVKAFKEVHVQTCTKKKLNILLVGAGDLRHVITTVAKSYRHGKKKLHFHILEGNLELYARDMLFLTIALEPQSRMGLQEKTELFLELYGNILVRKQSEEYVAKMATEFIKMVTDFDYLHKKLPAVDLSQLKFKERDFMEAIFKFWRNREVKGVFEVSTYWDLRQRQYLGVRYDSRTNVYDWDYNMRLVQRDADIINSHEYKHWRDSGVAFEIREGDYEIPNKTMASGLILTQRGEKHAKRGYWGDILVSPYIAIGIECEEKSFFKKTNKVYTKTAGNIAEYNVLSMLHEIATLTPYVPPQISNDSKSKEDTKEPKIKEIPEEENREKTEDEKKAELLEEFAKADVEAVKDQEYEDKKHLDQEYEPLPLEDVQITFLPLASLLELPKKSIYKNLFDVIYFSNSMVHLLKPEINPMFADKASVIIESARYMIDLKLEQVKMFVEKVQGIARAAGCKSSDKNDPEKANFIRMTFERKADDNS